MAQNESGKGCLRWKFQQYLMTKSPAKSLSADEIAPVAPPTHDHVLLYGRVYYMYQYTLFQKLFSLLRIFLFWRNSKLILPLYFPRPQGNNRLSLLWQATQGKKANKIKLSSTDCLCFLFSFVFRFYAFCLVTVDEQNWLKMKVLKKRKSRTLPSWNLIPAKEKKYARELILNT